MRSWRLLRALGIRILGFVSDLEDARSVRASCCPTLTSAEGDCREAQIVKENLACTNK
jgi:hypothetical protein